MPDNRLLVARTYSEMEDFSKNIDVNFFHGLHDLLTSVNTMIDHEETTYDDLLERLSLDQGCTQEQVIELAQNFFGSINPVYKKQFEEMISTGKLTFTNADGLSIENSSASKVILSGNYSDFHLVVHEATHNFHTWGNNWSALSELLCEVDAIIMEMLSIDYLKKQKNINQFASNEFCSVRDLDLKENDFFQAPNIQAFISLFDNQKNGNTDFNNASLSAAKEMHCDLCFPSAIKVPFALAVSGFSHQLGYILATYIHEKISENPANIHMLEGIIQALNMSNEKKEEEAIKILSEIGIPIVRDGKLLLDDENINLLGVYFKKNHQRRKSDKSQDDISDLSITAGQVSVKQLVAESIIAVPDLTTLNEIPLLSVDKKISDIEPKIG